MSEWRERVLRERKVVMEEMRLGNASVTSFLVKLSTCFRFDDLRNREQRFDKTKKSK